MREEQNAYAVSYDELSIALSRYCDTWFEKHDHAQWEDTYKDGDWHCSKCGAIVEKDEQNRHNWYFCYHCGSPMKRAEGEPYATD